MVGLLCKVKSQGSFWWVLYASPKAALFSMSHHYNHNGHTIKITFDSCFVILSDSS